MSEKLYKHFDPKLTIGGYFAGYLSEGLVRSIVLLLAFYIPTNFHNVDTVTTAVIMALAYLPWHFKFLIGLGMDLSPTYKENWRRRPFIGLAILLEIVGFLLLISLRGLQNVWLAVLPALSIVMLGDAILDAGMDALLLDVAPPDWHGLGLGTGWGARAIGYSVSTILTLWAQLQWGWNTALSLFLIYSIIPLPVLLIQEPPETKERKINKESIALTFTDKAVLTWAGMAFLGCIIYTLDPARGFLGQLTKDILQLGTDPSLRDQIRVAWYSIVPFGVSTALASVGMGKVVDKIGHKKGYYISLVGASLSVLPWFGVYLFPSIFFLVLASIILGFFSGFCFVAWETVLADTVPPNFPAFLWQYYMGWLHLMAFVFGPIMIIFMQVGIVYGLLFIMLAILIGFVPAKLLRTVKTSKGHLEENKNG